jgi:hypothetical protein
LPIILTTTIAKKNLKYDAKKVVICQIMGKLNIPKSPNSKVKKPKKLIFIDDNIKTVNGKMKDIKINTLLVLLNSSFCNSNFRSRNMWLGLID